MQFNTTYNTYEPLLEVAPYYDCYPSLYIDPNLSHYFSDLSYSPQASVDEQLSPLMPMVHRDSISTPPVYYSVSPMMAYLSPPPYIAASPQSEHSYIAAPSPQSDCSYSPSDCELKSQENCGGGGKKRITKSTRAKRNQVLCEHTGGKKKNNKQQEDDDEKQFKCTIEDCGKVFKRAEHLKRHVKSIHDRIKGKTNHSEIYVMNPNLLFLDFECNFPGCDRAFSRSDNLNQHLRTHRSESIKKKRAAN